MFRAHQSRRLLWTLCASYGLAQGIWLRGFVIHGAVGLKIKPSNWILTCVITREMSVSRFRGLCRESWGAEQVEPIKRQSIIRPAISQAALKTFLPSIALFIKNSSRML